MAKVWSAGISAIVLVTACAALGRAEDISAKNIFIKDNAEPTKRQVQVQSADAGVQLSKADVAAGGVERGFIDFDWTA